MRTSLLACSVLLFRPCAKAAASPCKAVHKKTNISSNKGLFFTVLSSWSGLILSARSKVGGGGALCHATKFPVSCRISSCLFTKNTSAWPTRWLCASCTIPATPRRSPAMPSAGSHSSPKVRQQSRQHQKLCGGHRPQPRPEPAGDPTAARDPAAPPRPIRPAHWGAASGSVPRSEHCQHRKNSCLPCVFYTAIPPRETARYFGISQNAVTTRVPRLRDKLKLLQEPKGGEL